MGKYQPLFTGDGGVTKFMKTTFTLDILFGLPMSVILFSVAFIVFWWADSKMAPSDS